MPYPSFGFFVLCQRKNKFSVCSFVCAYWLRYILTVFQLCSQFNKYESVDWVGFTYTEKLLPPSDSQIIFKACGNRFERGGLYKSASSLLPWSLVHSLESIVFD